MKLPFKLPKRKSSYEIDMTNGPLLGKITRFAIPLALAGILQLLFNAADIVVAGRFAGPQALAAVGSTGALNMLIVNLFMGLSVGVNVLVARYYGGGAHKDLSETVHTAILTAMACGLLLVVIGISLSRPLLTLMGTPEDVIGQSVLYMRIVFAGMPAMMTYNFGAAVLRLNLFCVIVLRMGVAGVAVATVVSQCISAVLVIACLVRSDAVYRLDLKRLRIYKGKLLLMTKIGVPAGIPAGCGGKGFFPANCNRLYRVPWEAAPYGGYVTAWPGKSKERYSKDKNATGRITRQTPRRPA